MNGHPRFRYKARKIHPLRGSGDGNETVRDIALSKPFSLGETTDFSIQTTRCMCKCKYLSKSTPEFEYCLIDKCSTGYGHRWSSNDSMSFGNTGTITDSQHRRRRFFPLALHHGKCGLHQRVSVSMQKLVPSE